MAARALLLAACACSLMAVCSGALSSKVVTDAVEAARDDVRAAGVQNQLSAKVGTRPNAFARVPHASQAPGE